MKSKYSILFLILILIFSLGCGQSQKREQIESYIKEIDKITIEWDAANRLANSTGRGNLAQPVAKLQEIQIKVKNLEVPDDEDAKKVNLALIEYMRITIDSYFAFMAEKDDDELQVLFSLEDILLDKFKTAFNNLILENEK